MNDEKIFLTPQEAESLLNDGDNIHTFVNPGTNMLIGADWSRGKIIELFQKHHDKIEIGGEHCRRMGHAIVVWTSDSNPLFIENNKEKLEKFDPIKKTA